MVTTLVQSEAGFEARFAEFAASRRQQAADVDDSVRDIIDAVKQDGDSALLHYTQKFDDAGASMENIRVSAEQIDVAWETVAGPVRDALELAGARIRSHHERQRPVNDSYVDSIGVELGSRWNALESVGLYVPGGMASYPSSVLMNAIPAAVAGVQRLVMCVPAPGGELNPLVLAAARMAGVTQIYRIGGAQAVAALAYGTHTIDPVDKIVGPGNAYVASAKRQVFGTVGIDMIAGPSEVIVIADGNNDPGWIAADLLAQAEHDASAQSILISDDRVFAAEVERAVESQLKGLRRRAIAEKSWQDYGAVILVETLSDAVVLANRLAPEHLELAVDDPETLLESVRHAGAVFLGRYTPETIGDYVGGSNHVLPTSRSARFTSGLSVLDFVKRTSVLKLDADQLHRLGPSAITLAKAEGLEAHGHSVAIRLNR